MLNYEPFFRRPLAYRESWTLMLALALLSSAPACLSVNKNALGAWQLEEPLRSHSPASTGTWNCMKTGYFFEWWHNNKGNVSYEFRIISILLDVLPMNFSTLSFKSLSSWPGQVFPPSLPTFPLSRKLLWKPSLIPYHGTAIELRTLHV